MANRDIMIHIQSTKTLPNACLYPPSVSEKRQPPGPKITCHISWRNITKMIFEISESLIIYHPIQNQKTENDLCCIKVSNVAHDTVQSNSLSMKFSVQRRFYDIFYINGYHFPTIVSKLFSCVSNQSEQ